MAKPLDRLRLILHQGFDVVNNLRTKHMNKLKFHNQLVSSTMLTKIPKKTENAYKC
jgi:hypothetical protein